MNPKCLMAIASLFLVGCLSVTANAESEQADVGKAVEILGESVAFDTVEGRGQVPAYAAYLARELLAGGFADCAERAYGCG